MKFFVWMFFPLLNLNLICGLSKRVNHFWLYSSTPSLITGLRLANTTPIQPRPLSFPCLVAARSVAISLLSHPLRWWMVGSLVHLSFSSVYPKNIKSKKPVPFRPRNSHFWRFHGFVFLYDKGKAWAICDHWPRPMPLHARANGTSYRLFP